MTNRLGSLSLFASLLTVSLVGGCSSSSDATLTVENQETVAITQLYVDAVGDESFSHNLLGSSPLLPGDSIILGVSCDHYDVEIVDEAGGDCIVPNVSLCFSDTKWIIDDTFCTFSARDENGKALPEITVPKTKSTRVAK